MTVCEMCGARVLRRDLDAHMLLHQPPSPVVIVDHETYWRDRISQEILGQRLSLDYERRPTHHRVIEGLEMASDLAKAGL
jgi:hypothetical protein